MDSLSGQIPGMSNEFKMIVQSLVIIWTKS